MGPVDPAARGGLAGRSATDERALEIRLTPAGRKLEEKARSIPEKLVACFGLPPGDIPKLREELRTLARTASTCAKGE